MTPLRNVYTPEQFRTEILGGNRCYAWVLNQIAAKKIKAVTTKPYLIPQSEAVRFINPNK